MTENERNVCSKIVVVITFAFGTESETCTVCGKNFYHLVLIIL